VVGREQLRRDAERLGDPAHLRAGVAGAHRDEVVAQGRPPRVEGREHERGLPRSARAGDDQRVVVGRDGTRVEEVPAVHREDVRQCVVEHEPPGVGEIDAVTPRPDRRGGRSGGDPAIGEREAELPALAPQAHGPVDLVRRKGRDRHGGRGVLDLDERSPVVGWKIADDRGHRPGPFEVGGAHHRGDVGERHREAAEEVRRRSHRPILVRNVGSA
jgi:hypothetical protein